MYKNTALDFDYYSDVREQSVEAIDNEYCYIYLGSDRFNNIEGGLNFDGYLVDRLIDINSATNRDFDDDDTFQLGVGNSGKDADDICYFRNLRVYAEVIPPPSTSPTTDPTIVPSNPPSLSPTLITPSPSSSPTKYPSMFPTATPITSAPSISPTRGPSGSPTLLPSSEPTMEPSANPTTFPSDLPSISPTEYPTLFPSSYPTTSPSTSQPSVSPSDQPTTMPSSNPTSQPSTMPSSYPTVYPSNNPTEQPTVFPSSDPTMDTTISPSTYSSAPPIQTETAANITNLTTPYQTTHPTTIDETQFFSTLLSTQSEPDSFNFSVIVTIIFEYTSSNEISIAEIYQTLQNITHEIITKSIFELNVAESCIPTQDYNIKLNNDIINNRQTNTVINATIFACNQNTAQRLVFRVNTNFETDLEPQIQVKLPEVTILEITPIIISPELEAIEPISTTNIVIMDTLPKNDSQSSDSESFVLFILYAVIACIFFGICIVCCLFCIYCRKKYKTKLKSKLKTEMVPVYSHMHFSSSHASQLSSDMSGNTNTILESLKEEELDEFKETEVDAFKMTLKDLPDSDEDASEDEDKTTAVYRVKTDNEMMLDGMLIDVLAMPSVDPKKGNKFSPRNGNENVLKVRANEDKDKKDEMDDRDKHERLESALAEQMYAPKIENVPVINNEPVDAIAQLSDNAHSNPIPQITPYQIQSDEKKDDEYIEIQTISSMRSRAQSGSAIRSFSPRIEPASNRNLNLFSGASEYSQYSIQKYMMEHFGSNQDLMRRMTLESEPGTVTTIEPGSNRDFDSNRDDMSVVGDLRITRSEEKGQSEISAEEYRQKEQENSLDTLDSDNMIALPMMITKGGQGQNMEKIDYVTWNHEDIFNWMMGLENGLFRKYENIIREKLKEEDLKGHHLMYVNYEDIKGFGVVNFEHKKILSAHIRNLISDGNNNNYADDGTSAGIDLYGFV